MATLQKMQEISSLAQGDTQVAQATKTRRFKRIPVPFLVVCALLVSYGLLVVFSATLTNDQYSFTKQAAGVLIGIVLMVLITRFDYHQLSHFMVLFLIINVVFILMPHVPMIGMAAKGATSWVKLGPMSFQPGEFAKITVILLDASVVARYGGRLNQLSEYIKSMAIMLVPFVCIMTQPDLGTGLVYLFIAGVALVAGGARPRYIVVSVLILVVAVVGLFTLDPIADNIAGHDVLLKEYQRARLLVFLDNSYDPTGDGYNLAQAQIAIGSGGFFGKGFLNATQSSLGYLPEAPTDFIFCVLAEQFGFLGALVLVGLYAALVVLAFRIAYGASDLFGALVVLCITGMWLFQILENIGMTIGLMPITGIPLPFMSYGSSFMVVNFVLLGMICSVYAHSARQA